MITYTYKCNECGEVFEVQQRITEDKLTDCIKCNSQNSVTRIIQPAGGFRIGGIGVYRPTSKMD